jgi:hypothetical protein
VTNGRRPVGSTGPPYRRRGSIGVGRGLGWVTLAGLGFVLSACGGSGSGKTLAAQVNSWASTAGFSASVSHIQSDLRQIDAGAARPAAIATYCTVLVTDALSANGNLPTPDQSLTNLLSTAYSEAGDAGHDCSAGAGSGSKLLARSATERVKARMDLIRALARFDAATIT